MSGLCGSRYRSCCPTTFREWGGGEKAGAKGQGNKHDVVDMHAIRGERESGEQGVLVTSDDVMCVCSVLFYKSRRHTVGTHSPHLSTLPPPHSRPTLAHESRTRSTQTYLANTPPISPRQQPHAQNTSHHTKHTTAKHSTITSAPPPPHHLLLSLVHTRFSSREAPLYQS